MRGVATGRTLLNRCVFAAAGGFFFLALTACQQQATAPPSPASPLTVSTNSWPGYYPAHIAKELGLFAKHGVKVELVTFDVIQSQIAEFGAGKQDGATLSLGCIVRIGETNPDVRVVLAADQSAGADAVVADPGISSVAGLMGKRLGTMMGTYSELFVRRMLEKAGMTAEQVVLVNMEAADVPAQLAEGNIDAGHTWAPHVDRATRDGAAVLFTSGDTPGLVLDVVAFQEETLRKRPEAVRAFCRAWFEAVEFWLAHPAEGDRIAAESLGLAPGSFSLEGIELLTREDNQRLYGSGDRSGAIYTMAEAYADFFADAGNLNTVVEGVSLLDPGFLPRQP